MDSVEILHHSTSYHLSSCIKCVMQKEAENEMKEIMKEGKREWKRIIINMLSFVINWLCIFSLPYEYLWERRRASLAICWTLYWFPFHLFRTSSSLTFFPSKLRYLLLISVLFIASLVKPIKTIRFRNTARSENQSRGYQNIWETTHNTHTRVSNYQMNYS